MTPITALALLLMGQGKLSLAPRFEHAAPLPGIPGITVDAFQNGVGLGQQIARNRSLQGRLLWVDATANIDRYNTETKIHELVQRIKGAGFNTVVFDIKPISGQVVYRSAFAPKLLEWRGRQLPADFDPLEAMVRETKAVGLSLLVSLNAFSEGHRLFRVGPGYAHPEQQTLLYGTKHVLVFGKDRFALAPKLDTSLADAVTVYSSASKVPTGETDSATLYLDKFGRVTPTFSVGGVALYGIGAAGEFLRAHAREARAEFDTDPIYTRIGEMNGGQVPLMMNPNHPAVRRYELDIAREVATKYAVDGIVYDDRLRYAGIDADFSEETRTKFESVIGKKLTWPDDVFKFTLNQNLTQGIRPGRYYDQWMAWRASVIRDYLAEVRRTVQTARPGIRLGMYVGSWYGEYPALGNNYASPDADAAFWFLSKNYRQAGDASLVDFVIPGCYYPVATIHDAMSRGLPIGSSVESAATLANRLVRDQAWVYAGLSLSDFKENPEGLQNALQAACASTQGVMVFDLSHDIEPMWPVFARAFSQAAKPPHATPLLAEVRRRRAALDKTGAPEPKIVIASGSAGTGQ